MTLIYSCEKHPVTIGTYLWESSGRPCAGCKKNAEKAPASFREQLERAEQRAAKEAS